MNRNNVIFHHDNARPHVVAKSVTKKLSEFNWEILPHPPYSPDIAPFDYHLFRALQRFLLDKKFENIDTLKNSLENYFKEKQDNFYRDGIMALPEKWEEVVQREGITFSHETERYVNNLNIYNRSKNGMNLWDDLIS